MKIELPTPLLVVGEYHPYKIDGMKNPSFDGRSGMLLDIKNPAEANYDRAVRSLTEELLEFLRASADVDEVDLVCTVPSHAAGHWSAALGRMANAVATEFDARCEPELLERTKTVTKLAHGGNRAISVHLDSIVVTDRGLPRGRDIIVLDDVSTTGNSLDACRRLLKSAGARQIHKVVLGKTTW